MNISYVTLKNYKLKILQMSLKEKGISTGLEACLVLKMLQWQVISQAEEMTRNNLIILTVIGKMNRLVLKTLCSHSGLKSTA